MHLVLLVASPALRVAPLAMPARVATPIMCTSLTRDGRPLLEESCTMGGGRPQGTLVRQSNGVIVPTTDESPSSTATRTDPSAMLEEACTMGGGRPQGTLVRQSNGVIVPTTDAPTASVVATPASVSGVIEEACTMGGGRPQGTLVRQSNGVIVPPIDGASSSPVVAVEGASGLREEACTMGGGRPSGTPAVGTYKTGSGASVSVPGGSRAVFCADAVTDSTAASEEDVATA